MQTQYNKAVQAAIQIVKDHPLTAQETKDNLDNLSHEITLSDVECCQWVCRGCGVTTEARTQEEAEEWFGYNENCSCENAAVCLDGCCQ